MVVELFAEGKEEFGLLYLFQFETYFRPGEPNTRVQDLAPPIAACAGR